jgi:proteic killer suppression protein
VGISFISTKLSKELNEEKTLVKIHGSLRAKKLRVLLAMLRAAPTLSIFAPPMSPPHRCHEFKGNRWGQIIEIEDTHG